MFKPQLIDITESGIQFRLVEADQTVIDAEGTIRIENYVVPVTQFNDKQDILDYIKKVTAERNSVRILVKNFKIDLINKIGQEI